MRGSADVWGQVSAPFPHFLLYQLVLEEEPRQGGAGWECCRGTGS